MFPRAKFDQMVFVALIGQTQSADIGMTAQNSSKGLSYAYYDADGNGDGIVTCDPLDTKVRKKQNVIFLDVPHSCLPTEPVKIKFTTATGFFRAEGVGYSRDTYVVPGKFEVQ